MLRFQKFARVKINQSLADMNKYLVDLELFDNEVAYKYYLKSKSVKRNWKNTIQYYEHDRQHLKEEIYHLSKINENMRNKINEKIISYRDFFGNKSLIRNVLSFTDKSTREKLKDDLIHLYYNSFHELYKQSQIVLNRLLSLRCKKYCKRNNINKLPLKSEMNKVIDDCLQQNFGFIQPFDNYVGVGYHTVNDKHTFFQSEYNCYIKLLKNIYRQHFNKTDIDNDTQNVFNIFHSVYSDSVLKYEIDNRLMIHYPHINKILPKLFNY